MPGADSGGRAGVASGCHGLANAPCRGRAGHAPIRPRRCQGAGPGSSRDRVADAQDGLGPLCGLPPLPPMRLPPPRCQGLCERLATAPKSDTRLIAALRYRRHGCLRLVQSEGQQNTFNVNNRQRNWTKPAEKAGIMVPTGRTIFLDFPVRLWGKAHSLTFP